MQQLNVLLQSTALGGGIGTLFDVCGGFWRGKKYRRQMFLTDVVLCALSAVITFFGALIVADGQLHPVLFVGILLGVVAEHYAVGRWLGFLSFKMHTIARHTAAYFKKITVRFFFRCASFWRKIHVKLCKIREKAEKC